MTNASVTGHRGASVAVLVVGGGGLAAGTWVGGDHGLAIGLIVIGCYLMGQAIEDALNPRLRVAHLSIKTWRFRGQT